MPERVRIPPETEAAVLTKSRRRCCLCFGLDGTDKVVQGQIAHLDRDPSNADEDNLAWMCLPHHDAYDIKPSQSKRITEAEARHWRSVLYDAMTRKPDSPSESDAGSTNIRVGDNNRHVIIGSGNTVNVGHSPTYGAQQDSTPLSDCEKRLLVQASSNDYGVIILNSATGGYRLNSAGRDIFNGPPGREFARWKEALNSLVERRFVEKQSNEFEYRLTGPGFAAAERLKAEDPVYSLSNEAIRLLREAAKSASGHIHFVPVDGHFVIKAGEQDFDFMDNPQLSAIWKAGFDELIDRRFIEQAFDESVFQITKAGHDALKAINAVNP